MKASFDVIVIGAGHAGCEAAYAAARLGVHVGLCTLTVDTVAHMPCNPAVGGTAKGHLVREIDALGGLMGRAIDATGIQFKLLNRSRGPAVWSPRAQADKKVYGAWIRRALEAEPNIDWLTGRAGRILVKNGRIVGLAMEDGDAYGCTALVVTTGTFLNGLIHIGPEQHPSGRAGEPPSRELAESLKAFGFEYGRLKTGTPPRLDRESIDFDRQVSAGTFTVERGDDPPVPFSFLTSRIERPQIDCYLLHTNDRVRDLVRANIKRSPLFNGQIQGIGPRYCPSLEDKIVRFPEKERHQIFLEPEGLDAREIYVNGFSMSLPRDVQADLVHALLAWRRRCCCARRMPSNTISFNRPSSGARSKPSASTACFSPDKSTGRPGTRKPRRKELLPVSIRRGRYAVKTRLSFGATRRTSAFSWTT